MARERTETLLALAGLALAAVVGGLASCGSNKCSPLPCPYPGFDVDACSCRHVDATDASADAADGGE